MPERNRCFERRAVIKGDSVFALGIRTAMRNGIKHRTQGVNAVSPTIVSDNTAHGLSFSKNEQKKRYHLSASAVNRSPLAPAPIQPTFRCHIGAPGKQ